MRYSVNRNYDPFDEFFDDMFKAPVFAGQSLMKTDVHEKDGQYVLEMNVPGCAKEDIKISLYNGTLTVEAKRHGEENQTNAKGKMIRQERYMGSCSRSFYVGDSIKDSDIHASFANGVLTLTLPTQQKKEEEEKKFIDIA